MNKKWWVITIAVLILILLAWAPWITKSYAENKVAKEFQEIWEGVSDGCGFSCDGCGVKESHRTLFGVSVEIEYVCAPPVSVNPPEHRTETKFVSFMGTIQWLSKPKPIAS